jgi:isochorismate synthase
MKFYVTALDDIDRAALRSLCSRDGWIVETPDSLRAGFGGTARTLELTDFQRQAASASSIFDGIEIEYTVNDTTLQPVAFCSVPFSRTGTVRVWLAHHTITVGTDGTISLCTSDADPGKALAQISRAKPLESDREYRLSATTYSPTPDGYARAVATAVEEMRHSDLQKVVLARRVTGNADTPIDAAVVAHRLHQREPACTLYAVPGLNGDRYVGASPELLISSIGGSVSCHPLAGTVALPDENDTVDYATWLLGSTKNLFEHRVVVDDIVERLATRCDDVRAESRPSIVTLRSVAHLGTWIHGKLNADHPVDAFELMTLLHPTPAVGGLPQARALELIERLEPEDRGLYAGAVGWFDAEDEGEWWVAIRGVSLSGDCFSAWAGAGIVADSDPIGEREETRDKLASILIGLGTLQ